ncbi:DUF6701 domain-containing protein [Pleionea sp. CnH1-48]|uniref:DUF6701 domain-containing protein n=1 Tax=Pleionea sp. CnH1-48 TaxID=2954494 RepID=UPI0020972B41|nr:DUF6701 domain-containing protein [Pleionea sp. CnH1-48]MCO7225479.1 hypothetical protein [Pleionea sp. CnH1-48]
MLKPRIPFIVVALLFVFSYRLAHADYVFQVVPQTAFDSATTDVVWTNDGSQTGFPIDDDYQLVNIGFTFYLGETGYTQVRILANGALHFGADQGFHKDYTNEALPITGVQTGPGFEEAADRTILGYWDDLEPSSGGTVRYSTSGTAPYRRFAVSWISVPRYNQPTTDYTIQIVIYENGDIRFRYGNEDENGSSATIGVEVDDSDFTQFSFNTPNTVNDANDILWTRELPAISSIEASCSDPDTIIVTFADTVSPARANDPLTYTLNNGASVTSANLTSATTVELTTAAALNQGITYTLSTGTPTQNQNFQLTATTNVTYSDNFSSGGYSGGTGTWASNWIEEDDNGSSASGNVFISGNEVFMDDRPNSGGEPALYRQVDLSAATAATLTVDLRTFNTLENSDRFAVEVSSNGGASYTTLQLFSNDFSGTFNYDISAHLSAQTRIRFRIDANYGGFNEFVGIDNIVIAATETATCVPAVDHFEILHDGNGINCLAEPITIKAVDSGGTTVTGFTGTVNLSLSTNNGNWFTVDNNNTSIDPAEGTLTDTANDDDGAATYQFVAADNGEVVLYLQNTHEETTNIGVTDGSITDDDSEGNITFRPFGFLATPAPVGTQIAGRPFNMSLTAAGQTPGNPNCGVIEEYAGTKAINFWSSYVSPATSPTNVTVNSNTIGTSEATSSSQNVSFVNGVAVISVQYNDVGQISLNAKDDIGIGDPVAGTTSEIIGGVAPFVVRPFGYDIQISTDPYADDANDDMFTRAGVDFSMTVRSVLWQAGDDLDNNGIPDPYIDTNADGRPDSGGDLSNNGATPNIHQISGSVALTPVPIIVANAGVLSVSSFNFSSFVAGSYTFNQQWNEVGLLQIDALTNDFMSTGLSIEGERINIGRFVPHHYDLTIDTIAEQCGTFTYAGFDDGVNAGLDKNGQPFSVSGNITAENAANGTTQNYQGAFAKLVPANISATPYNVTAAANATGTLNFSSSALSFSAGTSSYSAAAVDYQHPALAAPFNLRVNINAADSDGITLPSIVNSNDFEVRQGRFQITSVYGPETQMLEMPVFANYYNGTTWIVNNADNCTQYQAANISFVPGTYTGTLTAGSTSATVPILSTLVTGRSDVGDGIFFSAPSGGQTGQVDVLYSLTALPWLGFDWNGDNSINSPRATISFGSYRGNDRVIYWREN